MTASSVTGGDSAKKLNDLGRGRAGDDRLRNHGRPVNDGISVEDAHKKLLDAWFSDTKSGEEYGQIFDKRLKKNDDQQNIIHRAIRRFRRKPNEIYPLSVIDEIESLVLEHPDFFVEADEDDKIPVIEAAKHNIVTLFRVIDLLIPKDTFAEIEKPFTGDCVKCPLSKVSKPRLKQCSRSVRSDADVISILLDGGQCLHHTVDVQRVLEKDKQLRKKLELVLKFEKKAKSCLESLLNQNNFDSGRKATGRVLPLSGFKTILQLCPDELFSRKPKDSAEFTPLQRAVQLYDAQNIDYGLLLSVIQALIDRHPDSIFVKDAKGRNAYRLLKESQKTRNNSRVQAEDLLKRRCIGFKRSSSTDEDGMWSKKSDFLYWDAETERQFCLNLASECVTLDKTYIGIIRQRSGIRFETVLASVTLPYWKPPENSETAAERTAPEVGQKSSNHSHEGRFRKSREQEVNPYPGIFDWLWEKGVRKIFTLDVDDDGPEPHTNASIRKALTGVDSEGNAACPRDFCVEVWKWKKFDICAETVAIAAPGVKRIHLYSHGNTAVLRGWATSKRLSRLEKLERLSIEIYPNSLDDEKDCTDYEEEFRTTLLDNVPRLKLGGITIQNHGLLRLSESDTERNRRSNDAETRMSRNLEKPLDTNQWIAQLKNFKSFILNLHINNSSEKPRIKVALLDSGAKLTDLDGIQTGRSFRQDKEEFFVGPCEHGTAMARCIREVCPMAELHIARLDDSRTVENQMFTIASCCQALKWAIDMKVDIISISWTFKIKGNGNDAYEKEFEDLLKTAVENNIVIFGALPDKTGAKTEDFAPLGLNKKVFKIGAATIYGEAARENLDAQLDFLLPGENLPSSTGELVSGSSYATAYASGLAAIVMFCMKAFEAIGDTDGDKFLLEAWTKATAYDCMKRIFKTLSGKSSTYDSDGRLFVRPYQTFGQDFDEPGEPDVYFLRQIVRDMVR